MPWFYQNELAGDEVEMSRDYPIPLYGCGICAMCAALYKLFEKVITPAQLRNILERRAEYEEVKWIDGRGIDYEPFLKLVSKSFSVEYHRVDDVEYAMASLSSGFPLIVGNGTNGNFNDMRRRKHIHNAHVVCFYNLDAEESDTLFYAMDSQLCGGARVPYTRDDFIEFVEASIVRGGRDTGSCYSITLRRPLVY